MIASGENFTELFGCAVKDDVAHRRIGLFDVSVLVLLRRLIIAEPGFVASPQLVLMPLQWPRHIVDDRRLFARRIADQERPQPRMLPPISVPHHLHREPMIERAADGGQCDHRQRGWIAANTIACEVT
jgi:hypothetical protein